MTTWWSNTISTISSLIIVKLIYIKRTTTTMYIANRALQAFHVPPSSMQISDYFFSHLHDNQSKNARFNVIWPFQSRDLKQLKRRCVWNEWNRVRRENEREREMPPNKRCALSLRGDDDGELDVASHPTKGEVSMVFMKRLTLTRL